MDATFVPYVVTAARTVVDLAARPEVGAAWARESACAGMTVGGLTQHLLAQLGSLDRLVSAAPRDEPPITIAEHYARAAWANEDLEADVNVGIRETSDEQAAAGQEVLVEQARDELARLAEVLGRQRTPDTVHIPWQGWSLATEDFVVTRCMEMVVHGDDLAASIEVPTPEFPDPVVERVLALLTGVAVRRHGQAAVVRALSRPQRAPAHVSAF